MRRHMGILLTVEGIIVAGLLVWAGFWNHAYDIYTSYYPPDPIWHVSLLLSIIYVAAFFSILGIIFAIFNLNGRHERLLRVTLTFWGYSWTCIIFLTLLAFLPLLIKAWRGDTQLHALLPSWCWLNPQISVYIFIGGSLATFALWGFYLAKKLQKELTEKEQAITTPTPS